MTRATLLLMALLPILAGCSVAARSPEVYRDDTAKILMTKNEDIRACYDAILKTSPTAQGRVTVKFDVETERGRISNVTIDSANTTAPESVCECVTKGIQGLVLAPPDSRKGEAMWAYDFQAGAVGSVRGGKT